MRIEKKYVSSPFDFLCCRSPFSLNKFSAFSRCPKSSRNRIRRITFATFSNSEPALAVAIYQSKAHKAESDSDNTRKRLVAAPTPQLNESDLLADVG